jgi:hypothetical protein
MLSFSQKNKYGYIIFKKCFSFFRKFYVSIFFSFLIIFFNCLLFGGALYAEYISYGINIFNADTLHQVLDLVLWDHLQKIGVFFMLLTISSFFDFFFKLALTTSILAHMEQKEYGIWSSIYQTIKKLPVVLQTGIIVMLYRVNFIANIIFVQGIIQNLIFDIQGKTQPSRVAFYNASGVLYLPLLAEKNYSVPYAIEQSETIMQKQFGKIITENYSFGVMKTIIVSFILSTFGIFLHYNYNLLPAILISLFIIFLIQTFIENLLIIFHCNLYLTSKKLTPKLFTKREISLYFS